MSSVKKGTYLVFRFLLNDILLKPEACSFAESSSCEIQSKALERSVRTAVKTPLKSLIFHICNRQSFAL